MVWWHGRHASAALGALLQARGYSVRMRKFDPYLNIGVSTELGHAFGHLWGEALRYRIEELRKGD